MHLLWDQKAYQKCEVGGEKLLVYDAREDYRNIKQKECKHVELATAGAAPRAPPAPGAHGPASAHGRSSWGARGARVVGKGEGTPQGHWGTRPCPSSPTAGRVSGGGPVPIPGSRGML